MSHFNFKKPKQPLKVRQRPDPANLSGRPSRAFSYYAQRSANPVSTGRGEPPPRGTVAVGNTGRRLSLRRRIMVIAVSLVLLAAAIDNLRLSSTATVLLPASPVQQSLLQPASVYDRAARQALQASSLSGNKLTINTGKISRRLQQSFPEVKAFSVGLPLVGHQPVVQIEPYQPACILAVSGAAYVIDTSGQALMPVSRLRQPGILLVPTVQDQSQSGLKVRLGAQVLPSTTVAFIRTVTAQLAAKHVAYGSVILPPAASQLHVQIAGTAYFVKFNLQDSARQQVGAFLAVKQQLDGQHTLPSQYVDVRLAGRAYYK